MILRPVDRIAVLYIFQGSFFHRLWLPCLVVFLFSSIVYYAEAHIFNSAVPLNTSVFALLGVALAIYHGFCNNAAYDRFWEARKLWGTLVWHTRDLARQVLALPIEISQKQRVIRLIIAYVHTLRHQLRFENNDLDLQRILDDKQYVHYHGKEFAALHLTMELAQIAAEWLKNEQINGWQWQQLDKSISDIMGIQAGCERISNTPIPFAYFVLLHRTVYWYCFLLPFGLGNAVGWTTPIVATFVAYTFMALNEIVDEISEPFGTAENDLPLTMMCDIIENQLCILSNQQFDKEERRALPKYIIQ